MVDSILGVEISEIAVKKAKHIARSANLSNVYFQKEKEAMNHPTCPLCNSKNAKLAFVKFNYNHFHCYDCKSLYVYPTPSSTELEVFYKNNEEEELGSRLCWIDSPNSHKHIWDVWKQALEFTEKYSNKGSLLDIGCGSGQFLTFAKKLGWSKLTGIEWNPEAANIARHNSDAVVYSTDILKVSLPSESFSGITLWDVIEHLNDVESVLNETFRLLKPGGVICIGTPHRYGLSIRLLQKHALTVNPPEHLIFFTQLGMQQALQTAGFNVLKQWSFSIYLREWLNFLSKFSPKRVAKVEDENYIRCRSNLTQSVFFLTLMNIANNCLKITNFGDQLIVIAQKPY